MVAGIEDPAIGRHVGFEPVATVEDGLRLAADIHGPSPSVAVVPHPQTINRAL